MSSVSALRGFATRKSDEVGFGFAVEFGVVFTVGLAAMNRREPSLGVALAGVVGGFPVTADVLTDLRISEPVIGFQKDPRSGVVLGFLLTGRNEPFESSAVFVGKINDVFLRAHSSKDVSREHNLAGQRLKLHLADLYE